MSWYPNPKLSKRTLAYLFNLQRIFNVPNPQKEWIPYILEPHQMEWHADDIAILGRHAKHRVVIKSRGTSFTVSCVISNLIAVAHYNNSAADPIPFVRLNDTKAIELLERIKEIIKHMTPIEMPDGSLYPFDPKGVNMEKAGSITFPNGVVFKAFPASDSASENIRGERIVGSSGMLDETNFMKDFERLLAAETAASSGVMIDEHGVKYREFQMNIGTTLKGQTPFRFWYEKLKMNIKKHGVLGFKLYFWPAFDPSKIDYENPLTEQFTEDDVIVPWHSLEDLETSRLEDDNLFKEEYMGIAVDSDAQFYKTELIMQCINPELKNHVTVLPDSKIYFMGVDVASINDYFVISIFEWDRKSNKFIQRYLYYNRKVELDDMEKHTAKIIALWKPYMVRIDAAGIGLQITQNLKRRFGSIIQPILGKKSIRGLEKNQNVGMSEFIHTNQKYMMNDGKVELINDELQILHYNMWNYDYKAESSSELGHGDIVMANAYALLPMDYKASKNKSQVYINGPDMSRKVDIKKLQDIQGDINWGD